ncbi:MAG: UDP-N-acetylglucosamine diphosphorylase [Chlamydiae bacterium]|nr:UDP-N-acetylglucosamine diphosphorylase [Chlamydiota bacterium]
MKSFFNLENILFKDLFKDCTYVWEPLAKLSQFFTKKEVLGKIQVRVPSSAHLINPEWISIGEGTVIEPGAFIHGPCVIGKNCEIRYGAYIRGYVVTGDGCIVGHDTELKRSILLNDVCAGHFNYIGDSILGNGVNLGAGAKCANLRLNGEMISIGFNEEKIPTHLVKLGAIIGDHAKLGCNTVTNPGTLIGKKTFCHPSLNISGYIPPSSTVKSTGKIIVEQHINAFIKN